MTILDFVSVVAWPAVVLILFLAFGRKLLDIIVHFTHVEVTSKPMRITLRRLEEEYDVPKTQIRKLGGLTGHDLWALDAFLKQPDDAFKYVRLFDAARKAMAFSFVEMGLLEIVGDGEERRTEPTDLARNVVDAANKLL